MELLVYNYISVKATNLFAMVLETTWVWGLAQSESRSMGPT